MRSAEVAFVNEPATTCNKQAAVLGGFLDVVERLVEFGFVDTGDLAYFGRAGRCAPAAGPVGRREVVLRGVGRHEQEPAKKE